LQFVASFTKGQIDQAKGQGESMKGMKRLIVFVSALAMIILAGRLSVFAASESVLWSFGGTGDGYAPEAGLINVGGNLYGTTIAGGAYGGGTLFELKRPPVGQTHWREHVRWSFGAGGDGFFPANGSLTYVGGSLYGTIMRGGTYDAGAVFKLTPPAPGQSAWTESLVWSFGGPGDGYQPTSSLIYVNGSFYGTTQYGGAYFAGSFPSGTAFKLTPPAAGQSAWSESVLWSFGAAGDGGSPFANLTYVGGNFYGTTAFGGADDGGTVFELTRPAPGQTNWGESLVWSFGRFGDGSTPYAGLTFAHGKLYGTTAGGGKYNVGNGGDGTVFELKPPASGHPAWRYRVVWSFGAAGDGASPYQGLIYVGGSLYGTTIAGGAYGVTEGGDGTLFKLTPSASGASVWTEELLWNFGVAGDGYNPYTGLIYTGGSFYGTTDGGGHSGSGTVFQITP
jgi:uncharacterized repeat protein (TIGR03803 family)